MVKLDIVLGYTLIILFISSSSFAQEDTLTGQMEYVDKTDLIEVIRGEKKSASVTGIPEEGELILFVVPIIGSNPTLGAFYGLGGTGAMYLGPPESTSISSLSSSVLFTTKDQIIATLRGTIMTPGNNWEMLIDVKYSFASENTYGLGSDYSQPINESWNIGGIRTSGVSGAQPLTFNQLKVHYTLLKAVADNLYVGVGYHLDIHYNIQDLSLDLESPEPTLTSHYAYSLTYGFDPNKYVSSGTSFNVVWDSRDHTVSAYQGSFLQASYRVNPAQLGSEKSYQQLYLEARVFKGLSKTISRHLIGLWAIGHFTTAGDVPYLHLPAIGYDMRNRIGRGYVVGRFRGPSWVTTEMEYRFPISQNGLFGGVLFGSLTTTSRASLVVGNETLDRLDLFEAIRPAGGFGARITLDRTGRLNLGLDMAFGQNGARGFYFNVSETF